MKVVNERGYKASPCHRVIELKVRVMLDHVPGAWYEPIDIMNWIATHSYVQDVELVEANQPSQHGGTMPAVEAPDCAGRNGVRGPDTGTPWTVQSVPNDRGNRMPTWEVRGPYGAVIAAPVDRPHNFANARLIAAAPDLLDALKLVDAYLYATAPRSNERDIVLRAIARATGAA